MTIIRNDEIQTALISKAKSLSAITALVSAVEIREDQWQGSDFIYPNIRVRMVENSSPDGCATKISVGFQVFTEDRFSDTADKIAGIIGNELDGLSFVAEGLHMNLWVVSLIPAVRSDIRTWRVECLMGGIVSKP